MGGILTLAFEAPQSLRANGAMLAAYLIALVPLAELLRAWERSSGGRYRPNAAAVFAGLLMLPVAAWHLNQYFVVQQHDFAVWNAFSTPETLTARALSKLDPDQSEAYVVSYFDGRPPLSFLAPEWRHRYIPIEGNTSMPLIWPADKDVWLFLDADSDALYQQLQTMYPDGTFTEQTPSFSQSVSTRTVHLTRTVLDAAQGLEARYYANEGWEGEPATATRAPTIDFDWQSAPPLPTPFSAEYEGVLRTTTFAPHHFRLIAPAYAELLLDERVVLSGTGSLATTLTPALGNHMLRVRAVGAPGPLQLRWAPEGESEAVLPSTRLFTEPVTANGLLGNFYANADWEGPVIHAEISPQLAMVFYRPPLPRPFSVEWTGKIAIPVAGDYIFALSAIDEAQLWIDGQDLIATRTGNLTIETWAQLSEGLHDIRVRYRAINNHSRIGLQWTPPGSARVPVPSAALFPPLGSYDRITMPQLDEPGALPTEFGAARPVQGVTGVPLTGTITTLLTDLAHPTGVAVGPDGRGYVVDSAARMLYVVSPDGRLERTVTSEVAALGEPYDVAVDARGEGGGTVYVLDAEAGAIVVFSADGEYVRTIAPAEIAIGRSRGLAVDAEGRIWVAHTPGQRLVALLPNGELSMEIPVWPGEDAQVTDVAVAPDGTIFAVAMSINKLVQYDDEGNRLGAWNVASANTVDSPHLALGNAPNGDLYITQPEESRIVLHSGLGADAPHGLYWQLPQQPDMVKPIGIAVAGDGSLWITDVQGGRLVRLEVETP